MTTTTISGQPRKSRKGLAAADPHARINVSFTVAGAARVQLEAGAAASRQTVGRYVRDLALAHLARLAADRSTDTELAVTLAEMVSGFLRRHGSSSRARALTQCTLSGDTLQQTARCARRARPQKKLSVSSMPPWQKRPHKPRNPSTLPEPAPRGLCCIEGCINYPGRGWCLG